MDKRLGVLMEFPQAWSEMPRRGSRKSVLEKKPKLQFVTSPLHGPACPVSPVFGALHPLTAKTIGVDESNTTWVSPHFQQPPNGSVGKGRCMRGRRAQTRLRRQTADKENHADSRHIRSNQRLKSLKFVGEEPNEVSLETLQRLAPSNDLQNDTETSPAWDVRTPEGKEPSPVDERSSENVILPKRSNAQRSKGDNLNTHSSICRTPNLIQSPLRILNFSGDTSQVLNNSLARRSSRLKEKYLDSLKVARTPPKEFGEGCTVLVADTPEMDYGLSVRRKQLAQLRIRKRTSTNMKS